VGVSAVEAGCRRESFRATAEEAMNDRTRIQSRSLLTRLLPSLFSAWCDRASPGKLKASGNVFHDKSHGQSSCSRNCAD